MKEKDLDEVKKSLKKLNKNLIEFEKDINKMISSITKKYYYTVIDMLDYKEFSITKNKIKELKENIKKYEKSDIPF